VVLCPDVAPSIHSRFDCRDLLQRSGHSLWDSQNLIANVACAHAPRVGKSLRRHARRALLSSRGVFCATASSQEADFWHISSITCNCGAHSSMISECFMEHPV
jgi:hypothetical protein